MDYGEFQRRFIYIGSTLGFIIFISFMMAVFSPMRVNDVIVLCLIYFTSGITALRIQRHEEGTWRKPAFVILNIIPGVLFVLVAFLISNPEIFAALLNGLWLVLLIYPTELLLTVLTPLFSRIAPDYINPIAPPTANRGGMMDFIVEIQYMLQRLAPFINRDVVVVSAILLGIFLTGLFGVSIARGIKMLFEELDINFRIKKVNTEFEVTSAQSSRGRWFSQFGGSTVRRYYRKFLKLCAEHAIVLNKDSTSAAIARDVRNRFGDFEDVDRLRDTYIKVRYGEIDMKDDVVKVRNAYAGVKKVMMGNIED